MKMVNGKSKLVNGGEEILNIGSDENPKSRTIRRMSKALKSAITELYPEVKEVHFRSFKEAVYSDKIPICKLSPDSNIPTVASFLWNKDALEELGMEKKSLLEKTLQFLQRPEDVVRWSL